MVPDEDEPVLAESEEEEEDPDRWKENSSLGGGTCLVLAWTWTSSRRNPVRVPGERHGVWLLLLVLRDGCGAGECVFLDYTLTQGLRSSRRVRLRRGVSLRKPLEEFPVLCVHALFARGNLVHYSSTTLYLAVYSSVLECCMWSTEHRILREMTLSGSAVLGSTVDTGFASVLGLWMNFPQFLRLCGLGS